MTVVYSEQTPPPPRPELWSTVTSNKYQRCVTLTKYNGHSLKKKKKDLKEPTMCHVLCSDAASLQWRQRDHVSVYSICLCASGIKWLKTKRVWRRKRETTRKRDRNELQSVWAMKSNSIYGSLELRAWIWLWSASDRPGLHLRVFSHPLRLVE